jgi:hypothetical protein
MSYIDISLIRGPQGWGIDDTMSIDTRHYVENKIWEKNANDMPVAYKIREEKPLSDFITNKFIEFMKSKQYGNDSADMTLLDEFIFGRRFYWLPQKTGSCVISNTFRAWVRRAMFEIAMKGDPEEYFGKNEFTEKNFSFYAPFSYGCGRRRGNLKGGDGSWCEVQYESLIKDGVIMCNNGRLLEILTKLNSVGNQDFPEPQDNGVYRRFQNWEFLDELLPFADWRLLESPKVENIDTHMQLSRQYKPSSCCSGIAIHKIGKHKDGFDIHAQNPRDSWAHNMGFHGHFESSDGKIFIRFSNESWGKNVIYNVPVEEVARWYSRKLITVQAIGEIDLPDSVPFI